MHKTVLGLTAILLLAATRTGVAAPEWETIEQLAADANEQVVELRRHFHANPELGNREFETAEKIVETLQAMGIETTSGIAHTGVVGILEGGKPGPVVALRADMDALPVTEETGLPFASTVTTEYNGETVGVMHACGHDNHMAMLLGTARVLSAVREELPGTIMFIFQPAEEGAPEGEEGGAELMLKEGIFDDMKPEAVFGLHVGLNMPGGTIALRSGPLMAAVDSFKMLVNGRQTHGARPWGGIDPVVVSSQIVLGLQTIASRQVDVTKAPSIITVGKMAGGVRNNIIPDQVEMLGTIRTFDAEMRETIHERIERTARSIAEAAGATIELEIDPGYPVTVNDPDLYRQMLPTLEKVSGERQVVEPYPVTGAEDFSYFANEVPGLYFFLGAVPPGVDPATAPSNHSPLFDFDEEHLITGVRALSHLAVDYLRAADSADGDDS